LQDSPAKSPVTASNWGAGLPPSRLATFVYGANRGKEYVTIRQYNVQDTPRYALARYAHIFGYNTQATIMAGG